MLLWVVYSLVGTIGLMVLVVFLREAGILPLRWYGQGQECQKE